MSVIIAVKDNYSVHVAADSCYSDGDTVYLAPKVVRLSSNLIVGAVGEGSGAMITSLYNARELLEEDWLGCSNLTNFIEKSLLRFMEDIEDNISLLVADQDDIFTVDTDGTCLSDVRGYMAVGTGAAAAMASLGGMLYLSRKYLQDEVSLPDLVENAVVEVCGTVLGCMPPVVLHTLSKEKTLAH